MLHKWYHYLKEPGFWDLISKEGLSIPTKTDCVLYENFLRPSEQARPLMSAHESLRHLFEGEEYNRPLRGVKARWLLDQLGIVYATQMYMACDEPCKSSDFAAIVDPSSDEDCVATVAMLTRWPSGFEACSAEANR